MEPTEAGGTPLGDSPPTVPIREPTDWRGCRTGGRGGERGQVEGEGEMGRGAGRKSAAPRACCWCIRAMATLVVAAAACKGAWTRGAQIRGCGLGETAPPAASARPPPGNPPSWAGMLSCLTICCTKILSQEPRVTLPAAPPPRLPAPPPRPVLLPATDPP